MGLCVKPIFCFSKSLTQDELKQIVGQLGKLQPGFLPFELFLQVARLVALPILELVPLRRIEGRIEVLLLERGANDLLWPGMLHIPGTVIRATDNSAGDAIGRIRQDELAGLKFTTPKLIKTDFHKSRRGSEVAQVYCTEVQEVPKTGRFYDVGKLPGNLVPGQNIFIEEAVHSLS